MKYADLHIHTQFSDGTCTPQRIVREARIGGLSCIAITDHDVVLAIGEAEKEARKFAIEVIPGIELSCAIDDYEVHILGYLIDWQSPWLQNRLAEICALRQKRALTILQRLRAYRIELDADELWQESAPGSIGRLHIARLLKKKGFVHSTQEAFDRYIGQGRPCYVQKTKLTPAEAIKMINRLKGVAVLAHPCDLGNEALILEFVRLGLRGIEAYYPQQDKVKTSHYLNLARKYGLLVTGGSDWHGEESAQPAATGAILGEVKVPYNLVEELKQEVRQRSSGKRKS